MVLPFRLLAHKRALAILDSDGLGGQAPYGLPWRVFRADLVAWVAAGLLMAALYLLYFGAPLLTGVKVLMGCLSFGLFGGILGMLDMERRMIARWEGGGKPGSFDAPRRIFSVARKMLFFVATVLLFMVLVILLMVFLDIHYLLENRTLLGPSIYFGVFREIVFAFGVLLVLSLAIMGRYARNLRRTLDIQVRAMDAISRGEYDVKVPVLTNDEFGLIAAKTNHMVGGLKERDFCRVSFGKYVAPEVSEKILKQEIAQEGELHEVTILFCDLRGYTSFVEQKNPEEVVRFLNDYFTQMEAAIRYHNGIVLQYIGDEIEAVFGAPLPEPNHPLKAVTAALQMRRRLEEINRRREETGEGPIQHGIGIHTGTVLAGNVGSPERMVFAMVGDAVNLASRIQTLNKQFGSDILVSGKTAERLPSGAFRLQPLGPAEIRGKAQAVEIYRLLA